MHWKAIGTVCLVGMLVLAIVHARSNSGLDPRVKSIDFWIPIVRDEKHRWLIDEETIFLKSALIWLPAVTEKLEGNDADSGRIPFDVVVRLAEAAKHNLQAMNCTTGFIDGRHETIQLCPYIANAVTAALVSRDEKLRAAASRAMDIVFLDLRLPTGSLNLKVVDRLITAAGSKEPRVRDAAVNALRDLLRSAPYNFPEVSGYVARRLAHQVRPLEADATIDPRAQILFDALVAASNDPGLGAQMAKLEPVLIAILDDFDNTISDRATAAKLLQRFGDSRAVPALCRVLTDFGDEAMSAEHYGFLQSNGYKPRLTGNLRMLAIDALVAIGDNSAIPALVAASQKELNKSDPALSFKMSDAIATLKGR